MIGHLLTELHKPCKLGGRLSSAIDEMKDELFAKIEDKAKGQNALIDQWH